MNKTAYPEFQMKDEELPKGWTYTTEQQQHTKVIGELGKTQESGQGAGQACRPDLQNE